MDDSRPIYRRIADAIRDSVGDGAIPEGERAPSTNELAAFHSVNPNTAARALTLLADEGLLERRRGLGMFVVAGARDRVRAARRGNFAAGFVRPLLAEAAALGITADELHRIIDDERTAR